MVFYFEENSGGFLAKIAYNKQKTDNVTDNEREIKITELIKVNNKISTAEMAVMLNVSKRTILRDVKNLKKKNKIKRTGTEKKGHWKLIK